MSLVASALNFIERNGRSRARRTAVSVAVLMSLGGLQLGCGRPPTDAHPERVGTPVTGQVVAPSSPPTVPTTIPTTTTLPPTTTAAPTTVADFCPDGDLSPSPTDGRCGGKLVLSTQPPPSPIDVCPEGDFTPYPDDGKCGSAPASQTTVPPAPGGPRVVIADPATTMQDAVGPERYGRIANATRLQVVIGKVEDGNFDGSTACESSADNQVSCVITIDPTSVNTPSLVVHELAHAADAVVNPDFWWDDSEDVRGECVADLIASRWLGSPVEAGSYLYGDPAGCEVYYADADRVISTFG